MKDHTKMKSLLTLSLALCICTLFAEGVRIDFNSQNFNESKNLPLKWELQGKLFTRRPTYQIVKGPDGQEALRITVDRASGTILYDISGILQKYPIMRWKWKVDSLPKKADGREPELDDQVIAVYIGHGRVGSDSCAYRWETETPKGYKGKVKYGGGMVKVDWVALRNKTDKTGVWYTEEVNAAEDLKKICGGKLPEKDVAVSISSNSQYTKSTASAEIAYIEFLPLSKAKTGVKK